MSENGPIFCKKSVCFRLGGSLQGPRTLFCRCLTHQNRFCSMVGMIFQPQNKSLRHFLSFQNKLTLLPLKTYVMPPLAAKSARYRAAEMVLVLYLLTIFGFLPALQLEHARTSPITVRRVAGSTLIFPRTTVEKIGGPFTFGGGGLSQVLELTTAALTRVRVGLRRPPSRRLLSRDLPLQIVCADTCPCGSHSPSPWPIRSTDRPGHRKSASELFSRTSLCSYPMSC